MADGLHFENSSSMYLTGNYPISTWYADANLHSEDGLLAKNEILQIQDGLQTPY